MSAAPHSSHYQSHSLLPTTSILLTSACATNVGLTKSRKNNGICWFARLSSTCYERFIFGWTKAKKASNSCGGHTFYHLFTPMYAVQVLNARDSSQQHVHAQRGENQTINNTAHRSLYLSRQSGVQIRVHQRASNRLRGSENAGLPLTSHTSHRLLSKSHL